MRPPLFEVLIVVYEGLQPVEGDTVPSEARGDAFVNLLTEAGQ